jgi:mannose-6-phosphate isomerase-like protein (cupin superfamily)
MLRYMKGFEVSQMDPPRDEDGHGYRDVLSSERLSVGFAVWPAGGTDRQRPHAEDEVYHVVAGRGVIDVEGEGRDVGPGSVVFVAAGVAHHFHSIEEELRVLVFWAPPHARVVEG